MSSPAPSAIPEILLDENCLIGYRENSTSARTENSQGLVVEVSFELRAPPALSLCFARCDDDLAGSLRLDPFGAPSIVSAAGSFALLAVHFSHSDDGVVGLGIYTDYFVYRAGPGTPSLQLLPRHPTPNPCTMKMLTVVPVDDGSGEHYAVVYPVDEFPAPDHSTLQIYRSDRKAWCAVPLAYRMCSLDETSVVYAGSGLIGWVNLWSGILLCNVLDEQPTVRFVPVPAPVPVEWTNSKFQDMNLRPFREMTVHDGVIRFIELRYHRGPAFNTKRRDDLGWMATTWTRPVSSDVWDEGSTFDTSDISVADPSLLHLLPEILDGEKRLTWEKVHTGAPTLSLHDDHIVYIVAKMSCMSPCVLTINTRSLTLEYCAQCSGKMIGFEPTYVPSILSSYFG
jgi:hypothetical protein